MWIVGAFIRCATKRARRGLELASVHRAASVLHRAAAPGEDQRHDDRCLTPSRPPPTMRAPMERALLMKIVESAAGLGKSTEDETDGADAFVVEDEHRVSLYLGGPGSTTVISDLVRLAIHPSHVEGEAKDRTLHWVLIEDLLGLSMRRPPGRQGQQDRVLKKREGSDSRPVGVYFFNREVTVLRSVSILAVFSALAGCSCSTDPGLDDGGLDGSVGSDTDPRMDAPRTDGPIVSDDGGVVITEDGGFMWTCVVTRCDGHLLECGDCIDNDGDGTTDARDPECLGPCDNTEGPALTAGVGGEGGASCNRDCYFDFGNGSGNDQCRWDTLCDPNSPDDVCPYEEGELGGMRCPDEQGSVCLDVCRPLTPNGCDCFGCCTFDALRGRAEADGGEYVWIGSGIGEGAERTGTCTLDLIEDTSACHPCEPQPDCSNDCGRCELCIAGATPSPQTATHPTAPSRTAGSTTAAIPACRSAAFPASPSASPASTVSPAAASRR